MDLGDMYRRTVLDACFVVVTYNNCHGDEIPAYKIYGYPQLDDFAYFVDDNKEDIWVKKNKDGYECEKYILQFVGRDKSFFKELHDAFFSRVNVV